MQKIVHIVATDLQGGIGHNNALLCHLPKDLKYFKSVTTGKPILMGHNTYKSIGRPLPNRENIVLSRRAQNKVEGVRYFTNLDDALVYLKNAPEIMVIGGGLLYQKTQPIITHLYQTLIHHHFNADTFYPDIHENEWQLISDRFEPKDDKNPFDLSFKVFERNR